MTATLTGVLLMLLEATGPAPKTTCTPFGPFCFNPELKFSDFLTPVTILGSMLTIWLSIRKERSDRDRSRAEKIRSAAAKTLTQIERWRSVTVSYYQDVQPLYVAVSELLRSDFDVLKARDVLWRDLATARAKKAERIPDEGLESSCVELSSYYAGVYSGLTQMLQTVRRLEEERSADLQHITQYVVLGFESKKDGYIPAALGNDLRRASALIERSLASQLEHATAGVRSFLIDVINRSDEEVINRKSTATLPVSEAFNYPSVFDSVEPKPELSVRQQHA